MTDREDLVKILDEYDPEGGTFPGQDEDLETFWGAQADAILGSAWLRKVKADTLREALAQGPKKYYDLDLYGHMGAAVPVEWLEDEAARIEGGKDD